MPNDKPSNLTLRDRERLAGVHPVLIAAIDRHFGTMAASGAPMMVVKGVRTAVEQAEVYKIGRDKDHIGPNVRPGHPFGDPVTMRDGVKVKSDHQVHCDGLGHAVDCAFRTSTPYVEPKPGAWEQFGTLFEADGFTWGGRWTHPHDAPHVEIA